MTEQRLLVVGTIGGVDISADVINLGTAVPVSITLTADYTMISPPGYPARPAFTGAATPQYPHTVPSGTSLLLLACEAAALIAAGGATLNG